jgi:hypothetical protein
LYYSWIVLITGSISSGIRFHPSVIPVYRHGNSRRRTSLKLNISIHSIKIKIMEEAQAVMSLAAVGAGLAVIGAGLSIGRIGGSAMDAIARQPKPIKDPACHDHLSSTGRGSSPLRNRCCHDRLSSEMKPATVGCRPFSVTIK